MRPTGEPWLLDYWLQTGPRPSASQIEKDKRSQVDQQTRHALKSDSFRKATANSVTWVSEHRSGVFKWIVAVVVIVAALLVAGGVYEWRTAQAEKALNTALDDYTAPLLAQGQPAAKGYFATAVDRAKSANQKFSDAAKQYGWTAPGAKAQYFAGVTYADMGQIGSAENELKTVSHSWNHNLANLAKLALANLYHRTSRDGEAVALLNEIVTKPSATVTAEAAELELAEINAASGKTGQARALWAKIKDADKEGAAGAIATQKLGDR